MANIAVRVHPPFDFEPVLNHGQIELQVELEATVNDVAVELIATFLSSAYASPADNMRLALESLVSFEDIRTSVEYFHITLSDSTYSDSPWTTRSSFSSS